MGEISVLHRRIAAALEAGQPVAQVASAFGVSRSTVYQVRLKAGLKPDRFWKRVAAGGDDECWPWLGETWPNGYGKFIVTTRPRVATGAHRQAWERSHRSVIDANSVVGQTCRNPLCCNPQHLYLGRKLANGSGPRRRPTNRTAAPRLSDNQVLQVRRRLTHSWTYGTVLQLDAEIAAEVGTTRAAISSIRMGLTYRHLGGAIHPGRYSTQRSKATNT